MHKHAAKGRHTKRCQPNAVNRNEISIQCPRVLRPQQKANQMHSHNTYHREAHWEMPTWAKATYTLWTDGQYTSSETKRRQSKRFLSRATSVMSAHLKEFAPDKYSRMAMHHEEYCRCFHTIQQGKKQKHVTNATAVDKLENARIYASIVSDG